MKSPEIRMGGSPETPDRKLALKVKAALKSDQAIEKGYDDIFFMDHEDLLKDPEIMEIVAEKHPMVIGYLERLNRDKNFVLEWFKHVDPAEVDRVYHHARLNAMRASLTKQELEWIKTRQKLKQPYRKPITESAPEKQKPLEAM